MKFEVKFNTKWSDFDPNRHMRHTAYNDYAAEVRVRFFQEHGLSINEFAKLNIGPILFKEETETPGSSKLNNEKREGSYHCANCGVKLFDSNTKYESGSGWPSFYQSLPDVFETKTDHLLGYARTEYHCKNCGGHHGHIFEDGPQPTGKRYCNNGICLIFKPKT